MIAVDTDVLVYAHRREAKEFAEASRKLAELAAGADRWAIPWACVYEFFSVVTNRRIWKDAASTQDQAWQQVEAWLGRPAHSRCLRTFRRCARASAGNGTGRRPLARYP